MAGLCFYFEPHDVDVWSGRRLDLDAWNYAAKVGGGIDRMVVVNKTDQQLRTPDMGLSEFRVVDELPALERAVYFSAHSEGATSLWDWNHDAEWYCFGPAQGWQHRVSPLIHVPVAVPVVALHAVHVATAVMLHRYHILGDR